ncbi:MAG: VWA domain-containing protein [Alphaproteobacteria bacterium]|nr:VWA domain-containing protein [Alphaproteobacteria bacterium]
MFAKFFHELKSAGVPVSLREYLALIEALDADLANRRVEDFYYLSRASLVKDEKHYDKFDRVFGRVFKGLDTVKDELQAEIPEEWLRLLTQRFLSEEEKAQIEALGGWDKLMETLKKRLEEQKERHEGGSKWIGAGGTSPFGSGGYNPEGVRIGSAGERQGRAVKIWERREYKNLDDSVELGTRNMKMALRRLRRFARRGVPEEFDLDQTIEATARAGYLDIKLRPERRNTIKVLIFFDAGGSMDPFIRICEQLFSAARAEFKHLEYFYFHNCLYDYVWKDNRRRWTEKIPTYDVLHKFPHDYKVIFVGDASMSPYEITIAGGSIEYFNPEPGAIWMKRVTDVYERAVWLNPVPQKHWEYAPSIQMMRELMSNRMYPLTLEGLDLAMGELKR